MKILLVATRDIDGPQTGRKLVLRTIVRSCEALGHRVDIVVIGPVATPSRCSSIDAPGLPTVCANVVRHFVFGRKSLNECLYWSGRVQRAIDTRISAGGHELVIADMVRTAQFCLGLRIPWVLDLDDLLSERYAEFAQTPDGRTLLGYFVKRLPVVVRRAAGWIAARLLSAEARRIDARERSLGRLADAVTLVSAVEARTLSRRLGRKVHDTPMGIATVDAAAAGRPAGHVRAVAFVGGLDYQPNLDALKHYLACVAPELRRLGCAIELHVIGQAPPGLRPVDPSGRTIYLGYVADLAATLAGHAIVVAPIVTGGGIKAKVLDAMASGMAVVATGHAVTGLPVTSGRECIVAPSPRAFAEAIARLVDDAHERARLGDTARCFVRANFSHAVMQEKWRLLLDDAGMHFRARTPPATVPVGSDAHAVARAEASVRNA